MIWCAVVAALYGPMVGYPPGAREAWDKFFCEDGPMPAEQMDPKWQLTCETYNYSDEWKGGQVFVHQEDNDPDRCFVHNTAVKARIQFSMGSSFSP